MDAACIDFGEIEISKIFDLKKILNFFKMSLLGVKIGPQISHPIWCTSSTSISLLFTHVAAKMVSETQSMLGFVLPSCIMSVVMLGTRLGGPGPRKQARAIF